MAGLLALVIFEFFRGESQYLIAGAITSHSMLSFGFLPLAPKRELYGRVILSIVAFRFFLSGMQRESKR